MISRIKCFLGLHDADCVPVEVVYVMHDTTGYLSSQIPNGYPLGRRNTYYWKCKRCKWEKEVGT